MYSPAIQFQELSFQRNFFHYWRSSFASDTNVKFLLLGRWRFCRLLPSHQPLLLFMVPLCRRLNNPHTSPYYLSDQLLIPAAVSRDRYCQQPVATKPMWVCWVTKTLWSAKFCNPLWSIPPARAWLWETLIRMSPASSVVIISTPADRMVLLLRATCRQIPLALRNRMILILFRTTTSVQRKPSCKCIPAWMLRLSSGCPRVSEASLTRNFVVIYTAVMLS